jgi:hypothetical protein
VELIIRLWAGPDGRAGGTDWNGFKIHSENGVNYSIRFFIIKKNLFFSNIHFHCGNFLGLRLFLLSALFRKNMRGGGGGAYNPFII